jgi:hypothetical protein
MIYILCDRISTGRAYIASKNIKPAAVRFITDDYQLRGLADITVVCLNSKFIYSLQQYTHNILFIFERF